MAFDPKKQVRANLDRDDVAKLAQVAQRLGWPEGEDGASVAGLVRRVCSDWIARVEGVPPDGEAAALPTLAELAARLARVERRLELGGASGREQVAANTRPALPDGEGHPHKTAGEALSGKHPKTPREAPSSKRAAGPDSASDLFTPEGLAAAMKANGYKTAMALAEAMGLKDRGRSVGRWLNGEVAPGPKSRAKLEKLLG